MRNPRVMRDVAAVRGGPPQVITGPAGSDVVTLVMAAAGVETIAQPVLAGKEDGLASALRFLKFDDTEISRITELVGTVASLASMAGWVVGAVTTIKGVLKLIGFLDPEPDASRKLLEAINARVEQIYAYLANQSKESLYKEAVDWRTDVSRLRNAMANLALSRSSGNLDALVRAGENLQRAVEQMLSPQWGEITFLRASQGYAATFPRSHWVDAATPFYMTRSDGAPVDYQAETQDLKATIWDPGYYLDVLFEAIGVRLAALAALEPGFRSTGYARENLRTLYAALRGFIEHWENSFFQTTVLGPIDPASRQFGGASPASVVEGHMLSHPWQWPSQTILVGAIDPVSGIAALEDFNSGFNVAYVPTTDTQVGGFWVAQAFPQAADNAYARRYALFEEVRARCGLPRLYDLLYAVGQLMTSPLRSEFVVLSDATFITGQLRVGADEKVSLDIIGQFAGKPGKLYAAKRYFHDTTKRFRIPMARRMDESQIQLGYKLVISVGDAQAELVLCEYSTADDPRQQLPLFPTGRRTAVLDTPNAIVYDVYQSSVFSIEDEDKFEQTGTVPHKRRLFLGPRTGPASVTIEVTFDFDETDPDHRFVGFADVEISTSDPEHHPDGFIAHVTVLETVVSSVTNAPAEELADEITLHFAPSFLVVDPDYFTDRDAGLAELGRVSNQLSRQYVRAKARLGPLEPITAVQREAYEQQAAEQAFAAYVREDPDAASRLVARYQVGESRLPAQHVANPRPGGSQD